MSAVNKAPQAGGATNESVEAGGSEGDRTDVPAKLISAAGPIFARHGFARATVREICSQAESNVASVGYYFGDKMGLYRAVIAQIRSNKERRFPVPEDVADPAQQLYGIIHTMLSRLLSGDESGCNAALLMREMQEPTEVFQEFVNEYFRPLFDGLKQAIIGLASADTAPHEIEQLAISVVGQCVYYRIGSRVLDILLTDANPESDYDIESLARHVTAVSLCAARGSKLKNEKQKIRYQMPVPNLGKSDS